MDYYFNNLFGDGIGWNFGVSTWIKNTKKALESFGLKNKIDAKLALSIGLPRAFNPIPSRFNVFMTLFETEDLFDDDYEKLNKADVIIVPCQANQKVLERNLRKDIPVYVAIGGFDPKIFKYKKREKIDKEFIFLYVGALNPRKGFDLAIKAFNKSKGLYPKAKLYIKTTEEGKDGFEYNSFGDIIYDYRILSTKELVDIYYKSHCLLLPSHGEGIGLTALEAAATGLPVIHTAYGGTAEFLGFQNSLPLKYSLEVTELTYPGEPKRVRATKWAEVHIDELISKMDYVYDRYAQIIKDSKPYLLNNIKQFSWKNYGKNLIAIFNKYKEDIERAILKKILNLGCGNRKYPGTVGVDIRKDVGADIVWDLSKTPYKFAKDESFDEVIIINTLEHLLDPLPFMKEAYRILKTDGLLHIQVPYWRSENFFIDPTHHHAYHELSMDFFDRTTFHGGLNNYIPVNFRILNRQVLETGDIYFILQKKCYNDLGTCACLNGGGCDCKK